MSGNANKYVDRTPRILPAGKPCDSLGLSVADCLNNYSIDDARNSLRVAAPAAPKPTFNFEPYKNKMRKGVFTEIAPILRPAVKTRYQTLINELKETTYDSHWNKSVGKGRDAVPGLPRGLNQWETTFGNKYNRDVTVKELVNPSKPIYQVLTDSQVGHELYKKSHNDYNIGERICRNYLSPSFDSKKRFGEHSKYDPRGIWVRCACSWHKSEPVVWINKIQADFLNKTRSKLGECLTPNNISKQLPPNFIFGKPLKKELYGVEELLKDSSCPPCEFKRDLKCWLTSFNKLKIRVKKVCNENFTLDDLYSKLLYFDKTRSGVLPLEVFYDVCRCYGFTFDRKNFEPLMRLLSILTDTNIDYKKILDIINYKKEPVELVKINDIPERNQYYLTSTKAAVCDYLIMDNTGTPPAGVPSIRSDLPRPVVPPGACRAALENLGDECSAAILLNPSVFLNYGLSFRDFFVPRKKETMRSLFEKVGYQISDGLFEKLWDCGVEQDKTGLVCVDTFNGLLQEFLGKQQKVVIDEATC